MTDMFTIDKINTHKQITKSDMLTNSNTMCATYISI
jgi:hypothetical protein